MIRRWGGFCLLLLVAGSPRGGPCKVPGGRYLWPLAGHADISSGFCDYRPWHYHGGIDISTGGKEGLPVRAADSGWVMRVSTSYWGYGKAVYLHLADGRVAVYGHLSRLAPRIAEYVETSQYATRRYRQNLWPAPDEIPVTRGEIIAWTGQTGSGPPHLHFEIRTGDNRPLNPLKFAFDKPDKTPPRINAVIVIPRQPHRLGEPLSTVDGSLAPRTFYPVGSGRKQRIDTLPTVSGVLGLAIKTTDVIDNPKWKASTYRCRLWVNDVLIAEVRHDSISYDDSRMINLERVFDGHSGLSERPLNLFRRAGNRLWHYRTLLNDGWLEVGRTMMSGKNELRIEAEDAAGNVSSVTFALFARDTLRSDRVETEVASPAWSKTSTELPEIDWLNGGVLLRLPSAADIAQPGYLNRRMAHPLPVLAASESAAIVWLPAVETFTDTLWFRRADGTDTVPVVPGIRAVTDIDGAEVTSPDGRVSVRFKPGDLYAPSFFRLRRGTVPSRMGGTVSGAYVFEPADVPFARPAEISFTYDVSADADRSAVYRLRPRRHRWEFEGAEHDSAAHTVTARVDWPGTFAVLDDLTPPTIRHVKPGRGARTKTRRPVIRFETFDDLSGIGSDADVLLTIDGDWVPVEYDPDTRQARARPRNPLTPGKHRVEITVKDRVGNPETFLRILHIVK